MMKETVLGIFLLFALLVKGQNTQNDTKLAQKEEENSGVFLNATSDSKPREISLGLPTNSSNAVQIFEDGMPVSYYLYQMYPYKSWHGGQSAERTGIMVPMDAAMRYGEINYYIDSYNRTGSTTFRGALAYTLNQYGQHKVDVNVSGPISQGWKYSLSTYQNFDKGSNHLTVNSLMDCHQFYKGVLSKELYNGRGEISLVYQYVNYMSIKESYGPFIFVGDGSVRKFEDFDLGHDNYYPLDRTYTYMDFMTGEMKTCDYVDGNKDESHHVTLNYNYKFDSGKFLEVHSRLKTGTSKRSSMNMAGMEDVDSSSGYSYANGNVFSGKLQRRNLMHFDAFDTTWMNTALLKGRNGRHEWQVGSDYWLNHGGTITSTAISSHEVKANPQRIYRNNESFYNFNTGGEYYDGYEHRIAVFTSDKWEVSSHLSMEGFLRLEFLDIYGDAANNIEGDKTNTRYSGFNLTKGKITQFNKSYWNGAVGLGTTYQIGRGLNFLAEGIMTRIHNNLFNYGGFAYPSDDPSDTKLLRAGFSFQNRWLNVVSQVVYITQNNKNSRAVFQHSLEKVVGEFPVGYIESVSLPVVYGISSVGWTTDVMVYPFKDFALNLAFTVRNPKYKDFNFNPTFSDGITQHYDFNGRNVTNLHKIELTVNPSYNVALWRFWLTARYISKQYINKTNSLYFKGMVETFGGIDYKMSKRVKLNLNVINILNQKGASGVISSADLVEDASGYKNYLMAGTFIRPFTVEIGVDVNF